jgi:hypothetical protein
MLADLPHDNQEQIMSRLALHLTQAPLGSGAVIAALTDVIVDTLHRSEREDG